MTRISAIVPAYNCEPYLRRAVESLLETREADLEVVIVDDGSTDGTFALANELSEKYPNIVRLYQHAHKANRGVAATRNLGIEVSNGEFLCFLDGDDFVHPNRFRKSLPLIQNDPSIDAVYELTRIEASSTNPLEACFGNSGVFGLHHPVSPDQLLATLLSGPIWHANSILVRKSFLTRTGRFKEELRTAEDCHLWYRMAALGRVVPGNFDEPVSSYCRREGSLFRPSWEARRELMRAMGNFSRWLRRANVSDEVRRQTYDQVRNIFENAITEARRSGRASIAWNMAWHAAWQFPSLMRHSNFWRQFAHIAVSPLWSDSISTNSSQYADEVRSVQEYPLVNEALPNSAESIRDARIKTNRISAIIPAYNCAPYLRRAVESILATKQPDLEVVIVDDGSSDDTLQISRQLVDEHPHSVFLYHHPRHANLGVSATRNMGIQQCTGDYICFLDADDYVHPHRFDKAVSILCDQPHVDGVHELAELVFETPEAASQWFADQLGLFGFDRSIASEELLSSLLRGFCWATSAILFRRRLLSKTGVFDTSLQIAEDCHLWFRMALVGTLVSGDLSRPVSVYWRRTSSAYRPGPGNRLHMIRSMTSFYSWARQHGATSDRLKLIAQDIATYIQTGLSNARESNEHKVAWQIATYAVRHFPGIAYQRSFRGQLVRMAIGR